jgi:hypothetical protein
MLFHSPSFLFVFLPITLRQSFSRIDTRAAVQDSYVFSPRHLSFTPPGHWLFLLSC